MQECNETDFEGECAFGFFDTQLHPHRSLTETHLEGQLMILGKIDRCLLRLPKQGQCI